MKLVLPRKTSTAPQQATVHIFLDRTRATRRHCSRGEFLARLPKRLQAARAADHRKNLQGAMVTYLLPTCKICIAQCMAGRDDGAAAAAQFERILVNRKKGSKLSRARCGRLSRRGASSCVESMRIFNLNSWPSFSWRAASVTRRHDTT